MNELFNNGPRNLDDYLKNAFDNYQPDVPTNLWSSLKLKLFKKDAIDFVTFKKLSRSFSSSSPIGVAQIKVLASYAAAACLAVGVVFGSSQLYKSFFSEPIEKIPAPTEKNIVMPVKPQSEIINTTQENAVPETNLTSPNLPALPITQEAPTAVTNKIAQAVLPVTNNTVVSNTQPVLQPKDNAETHTSLQNYIDRVNLNEKPVSKESVTQYMPETIDIPVENDDNVVVDETELYAYNLEIPNVFTPNGDGYNDYFKIKNLDKYSYNSLTVASRNGKIVYEVVNYQNNWDAQNLEEGTYYYILSYKDNRQNNGVIKGSISIVR